jgi:uncharacterized protein HemY
MEGMEKQLTAVEWLVEKLTETPYIDDFWGQVKKAKEMEKEQIMGAWHGDYKTAEQYYNETFKSE